jgi:uncharacterized surface protein with fasciclin (FAS1) repeats
MKSIFLNSIAIITAASFTLFGCASSTQNADTAAIDTSATTTMGGMTSESGKNQLDVLVVESQVMVPVATIAVAALPMENTVEINDMFKGINDTEKYNAYALAKTSPNLSTFVKLIEHANLVDDLERVKEVTLLAPTNEAFAKMPREKLTTLLAPENTALLSRMLQAHIIAKEVSAAQFQENDRIRITENSYIPIETTTAGTSVLIGGAQVVKNDIEASNGRIHVLDNVILPSENFREGNLR